MKTRFEGDNPSKGFATIYVYVVDNFVIYVGSTRMALKRRHNAHKAKNSQSSMRLIIEECEKSPTTDIVMRTLTIVPEEYRYEHERFAVQKCLEAGFNLYNSVFTSSFPKLRSELCSKAWKENPKQGNTREFCKKGHEMAKTRITRKDGKFECGECSRSLDYGATE